MTAAPELAEIERAVIAGLLARPAHTWCPGCHQLLDRLEQKVAAKRKNA